MNNKLFFMIFSGAMVVLTLVTICTAPIINNIIPNLDNLKELNISYCENLEDSFLDMISVISKKKNLKLLKVMKIIRKRLKMEEMMISKIC